MTPRLSQVLLALATERFSRFTTYLDEVSLICSDAELQLVDFLKGSLHRIDEREIKGAERILKPEPTEQEERYAARFLILATYHMDLLLSETEVFPRQRPLLEVYDFLEKAFPEVLSNGWQLIVVLWHIYNFAADPYLAARVKKALGWMPEQPAPVVLYLAEIERYTPTMWVLLAHEMGHALDEAKEIGQSVSVSQEPLIAARPYWVTELVADCIAVKVLGPAYFCAFASLALLDYNPAHYSDSHPALYKRLEMLKRELESTGVLEGRTKEVVDGYYQLVLERIGDKLPDADRKCNWDDFFRRIGKAVNMKIKKDRKFSKQDRKRSEFLADLLQKGTPISSFLDEKRCRSINEKAKQLIGDLKETSTVNRQNRLGKFKGRLKEIIDEFVEESTDPIWVLNAGCLDRWGKIKERDAGLESLSDWQKWLRKTDTILKKSIEAIVIHEKLRRNKDAPQRASNY